MSPEGAADVSPGRKPWVRCERVVQAPKGRQTERRPASHLSPFQGLGIARHCDPGLAPWAEVCRPFRARAVAPRKQFSNLGFIMFGRSRTTTLPDPPAAVKPSRVSAAEDHADHGVVALWSP